MTRTLSKTLLAIGATLGLLPLSPALGSGGAAEVGQPLPSRNSDNLELVAHIPGTGGTDIEFFSRELDRYLDEDLQWVELEEPTQRHFAFVGNQSSGAFFVDITDPEAPYEVSRMQNCTVGQGDPQVNAEGTLGVIARQTSGSCRLVTGQNVGNGSIIVDLSDPYAPLAIAHAPESQGSHNNTLHPGGRYLYISTSATLPTNTPNSRVPIWDLEDPAKPRHVRNYLLPGNGPHDIRFSHDGTRAYLAGISQFHILDTEDPENPSLISTIVPPGGSIGHDTLITRDKRFLFLGDEGGGGGTYPCPGGAIYVYDLLDERAPILLGAAWAGGGPVTHRHIDEVPGPVPGIGGCTSHVMDLNPDGQSLTIGWYRLGTRVFDFSSFYNEDGTPKDAAGIAAAWGRFGVGLVETGYMVPTGANTWSAKQYDNVPGYIFSDDLAIGFYVTKILDQDYQ